MDPFSEKIRPWEPGPSGGSAAAGSLLDEYLASFVSHEKLERFDAALAQRTRHLAVVLEDVYQRQNASAALRSCDCFGIQDVHIIENALPFRINPDVARGGAQWLTLHHYDDPGANLQNLSNTPLCLNAVKARGYRIIAAAPPSEPNVVPLHECNISPKTAILFGNEQRGLSAAARELVDGYLTIPMHGLTRSFNLSVAVALCLYELTRKLRASGIPWRLSENERAVLRAEWVRLVLKKRLREHEATFLRLAEAHIKSGAHSPPIP